LRGLDTNILVRFVTEDDPDQFKTVKDLFERAESEEEQFHVSTTALCELVVRRP